MPSATVFTDATTANGYLLVLAVILPIAGILLSFAVGAAVFVAVWYGGKPLVYIVGGFEPPLGLALRADGISAAMMLTTAVVMCAVGLFAREEFVQPRDLPETRAPLVFWSLLLAIWGALNAIVLGDDLFNLYVALELLTFAAVPLVCLKGYKDTIRAALRYLLFALLGSALYLLGTALLYGAYGTLDIILLSRRVRPDPTAWVALSLM